MTVHKMISEAECCDCVSIPLSYWWTESEGWFIGSALIPIPEEHEQLIEAMAEIDRYRADQMGVQKFKIVCPQCDIVFAEGILD